jgi:hypothetical protein
MVAAVVALGALPVAIKSDFRVGQAGESLSVDFSTFECADADVDAHVPSCPVLSCPVVSCRVLSCPAVSCRVLTCPAVSCRVLPCPAVSCRVLPCPAVSCRVLSCPIVSLSYRVVSWRAVTLLRGCACHRCWRRHLHRWCVVHRALPHSSIVWRADAGPVRPHAVPRVGRHTRRRDCGARCHRLL